jgi:hypothetical protein
MKLWAFTSLQATSTDHTRDGAISRGEEDAEAERSSANQLALRLLDLALLDNRRAAYQEFATAVRVEDDERFAGGGVGIRTANKQLLKDVLLSEEARGLIWFTMARGFADPDDDIQQVIV